MLVMLRRPVIVIVKRLKRGTIVKAAVAFALLTAVDACVVPSFGNDWHLIESGSGRRDVVSYMSGVLGRNRTGLGPHEELKLAKVILTEAIRHDMDPLFVLALIKTESTYYNWSKSFAGALGLMQIRPETGRELAGQLQLQWNGEETLLDPYLNVRMGVHYLSSLNKRYNDLDFSLAAYNVGPRRLDTGLRQNQDPGRGYVNKVLANYRDLKERADLYSYEG